MTNQSEQINELMTALAKAQGQMTHASKDSENPHFRSKFADLASVWQACRSQLAANGLAVTQTLDITGDRQILVTTLGHCSGQWIRSVMILPITNKPQETGSILTYFRRYSLAAICGVYQDDDDAEAAQAPHRILSEQQCNQLDEMLRAVPEATQWILDRFGIKSVYDLKDKDFEFVASAIRKKMKKQKETTNE